MKGSSEMKRSRSESRRLLLYAVPLTLILAAACSGTSPQPMVQRGGGPVPVLVAKAETRSVPVQVQGIGTVEAYSTVTVKSLVSGALKEVRFKEGDEVKKDALLFTIDPRPFQADLQRAEANLARDMAQLKQAEANVARDRANAENAAADKRRYEQLYQKGVVAKEQYDQYSANSDALEAAVQADLAAVENAKEAIKADQAAIESAKLNLEYCYINAPISGRTGDLLVNEGNLIKNNDTSLVVINQVHPIYVNFSVPEQNLPAIRKYAAAGKVRVDASVPDDSGAPVSGILTFIDNSVNSSTGTIMLKGTFENNAGRLWPGQFVAVTVTLTTQPDALVVPNQAVQTGQQGDYVFVVNPDMRVESRPVTVGRIVGGETVIEKGLAAGEAVVTDGQVRLVPGAQVQVKTALQVGE